LGEVSEGGGCVFFIVGPGKWEHRVNDNGISKLKLRQTRKRREL